MTFDPFDDFETRGYLRNLFAEKDLEIIRHIEHSSFVAVLTRCLSTLDTHKALFEAVYPWAGQDRLQTAPDIAVSKGTVCCFQVTFSTGF